MLEKTNSERLDRAKDRFAALKRGETISLDQDQDQDEDEADVDVDVDVDVGTEKEVPVVGQEKRDIVMT